MINITKEVRESIERCKTHWKKGIQEMEAACREYVWALDKYSNARAAYRQEMAHLTPREWDMMERVGRGTLTVMSFVMPSETQQAALDVFDIGIQEVLVGSPNKPPIPQKVWSRGRVVNKTLQEMSSIEVETLVDKKAGRLRTIEEQQSASMDRIQRNASVCYTISGGRLIVNCRASFTIDEVADILRRMKGGK